MKIQQLQNALGVQADGIVGRRTQAAMDKLIRQHKGDPQDWALARRLIAAAQCIYADAGLYSGAIDGLEGELTRYAEEVWMAHKVGAKSAAETLRSGEAAGPQPVATEQSAKWPRQRDVASFFGEPGANIVQATMPFALRIAWEPTQRVTKISCNKKCVEAFQHVWERTLAHYGEDELRRLRLDMYGGCFNKRKMRGGTSWSIHSYGAAWDVDPDRNQLKWGRDKAELDGDEYAAFWAIVRQEGGISLGKTHNYDWMHFQFTKDFS